jgi:hypothetical protein
VAQVGTRKDQYAVRVSVDGNSLGIFDVMTGGDVDTTELVYHPGGMGPTVALGGLVSVAAIVLSRLFTDVDQNVLPYLISRVGKGDCVVTKQPLDVDGNAYGKPIVYHGKLKRCKPPEVDSNATAEAVMELEVTPAGSIT